MSFNSDSDRLSLVWIADCHRWCGFGGYLHNKSW